MKTEISSWRVLACVLASWLLAGSAGAEVRRIEEVGAVPLKQAGSGLGAARDAAKQAGLRAAVERVAQSFLMEVEAGGAGAPAEGVDLGKVLGRRMVPYTTRFRVLEDKGERPAMFASKRARTEYVVVVEVFVDADRVEQRLIDAGLLETDPEAGEVSRLEIELRGLSEYGALRAVRELLTERIGATSAVPQRFERGVAVLDVELPGRDADPAELIEQMKSLGAPSLRLRAIEMDAQRAVVEVSWRPPADSAGR